MLVRGTGFFTLLSEAVKHFFIVFYDIS